MPEKGSEAERIEEDRLPSTLERSDQKAKDTYAETLASAEESYGDGARAHHAQKERCVYCDIIRQELADAVRERRPALKVLFITGYAENAAIGNGLLAPGMQVITKPFAMDVLATKVRSMTEG